MAALTTGMHFPRMARRFLLPSRLSPTAHRQPHRCQPRCEPASLQVVTVKLAQVPPETSLERLRFLLRELATDLETLIQHALLGPPRGLTMTNKRMPYPAANAVSQRMCTHATRCAQSRRPRHPLVQQPKASAARTLCFATRTSAPQQCAPSIASALRRCMTGGRLYIRSPSVQRPFRMNERAR